MRNRKAKIAVAGSDEGREILLVSTQLGVFLSMTWQSYHKVEVA